MTAKRQPRAELILVLAGFCLILLQFFMIREVTALLRGTEIVILLVTIAYFLGYSVGYGASRWLPMPRIRALALVTWAVHLTLPFSFRYLGGSLWSEEAGLALVALLFLTAFALSSFYSVLLPRFIDEADEGAESLARYYGFELLGAVAGVVCLLGVSANAWLTAVIYQAGLALVIGLVWSRAWTWALVTAGVVAYAFGFSPTEKRSLDYRYATIHRMEGADVLFSANTLYQKVDILRDAAGRRHIYLSGRQNYGSSSLTKFNQCLSLVPAKLVKPKEALIIGSGSMESVRHVAPLAGHVTTVELDAAVIHGSRTHLADVNQLAQVTNWTCVIDDAKQYLGRTEKKFDLIVMDVPVPSTIQLALLHSVEFYRLARSRLHEQGVLAVSLCGHFSREDDSSRSVAASLMEVFAGVMAYTPTDTGRSFAVAGDNLPFTTDDVRAAVLETGAPDAIVWHRIHMPEVVMDAEPITADNMRVVVQRSWEHLTDFYLPEALE